MNERAEQIFAELMVGRSTTRNIYLTEKMNEAIVANTDMFLPTASAVIRHALVLYFASKNGNGKDGATTN